MFPVKVFFKDDGELPTANSVLMDLCSKDRYICIFGCFHNLTLSIDNINEPILYLPHQYIKDYNLKDFITKIMNSTDDFIIEMAETVAAPVLDCVYLNVTSHSTTDIQGMQELLPALLNGKLVKKNSIFRPNSDFSFYVLSCDPFAQGKITKNTKIVISSILKQNSELYSLPDKAPNATKTHFKICKSDIEHEQDYVVYTTWATLVAMKKFNGDYVRIRNLLGTRIVQLKGSDFLEENAFFVSDLLFRNFNGSCTVLEQDIDHKMIMVADAVTLARIPNPALDNDSAYQETMDVLVEYFGTKRLVTKNDYIRIKVNKHKGRIKKNMGIDAKYWKLNGIFPPNNSFEYQYFQVVDLKGAGIDSMFVDPQITKVVVSGIEQMINPSKNIIQGKDEDEVSMILQSCFQPDALKLNLFTSILLIGASGCGKCEKVIQAAKKSEITVIDSNLFNIILDTIADTAALLKATFSNALKNAPAILLLKNINALSESWSGQDSSDSKAMFTECIEFLKDGILKSLKNVVLIATANNMESVSNQIYRQFLHIIDIPMPSEAERVAILSNLMHENRHPFLQIKEIARQTAGLSANDLKSCVAQAYFHRLRNISDNYFSGQIKAVPVLSNDDLQYAVSYTKQFNAESLGTPKIPNVQWEDIGGLDYVRDTILETIQLPLLYPNLFKKGVKKRSGILLYGPPGTGKTLVAKAVATTLQLNFFSVKGPELLNMYIGESEANVREVFRKARASKPCVIFFDELDSIAPQRGDKGDSGGVMDRIVAQLLAELDGMEPTGDVFVIGATNRPDLLDGSLLRPGRFDKLLYLGVHESESARLSLIQSLTRKFILDEDCELQRVLKLCPSNMTGADFYALCSNAMSRSISRRIIELTAEIEEWNKQKHDGHPFPTSSVYYLDHIANPMKLKVSVSFSDFEGAVLNLQPSVPLKELERYRRIRDQFEPGIAKQVKVNKGKGRMITQ